MEVSQTMLNVGACVLAGVIAYLLGSISFAIIVSRIYAHDDVRKYGSKNAGMTNILRTYGKMPAFFTLPFLVQHISIEIRSFLQKRMRGILPLDKPGNRIV